MAKATTDAEGLYSMGEHVVGDYAVQVQAKDADATGTERNYEVERVTFNVSGPVVAAAAKDILGAAKSGVADFILPLQKFSVTGSVADGLNGEPVQGVEAVLTLDG